MRLHPSERVHTPPGTPAQRRLLLFACFALFFGFAVYGSFVPFQLTRVPLDEALARFPAFDPRIFRGASGSDFVANVLLFVPIGFTLAGALADRSRALALLLVPLVSVAAYAASVGIEFGQIFMAGRTPSWHDIAGETIGATFGALAWTAIGPSMLVWLGPLVASAGPVERARRLLGLYIVIWLVLHVIPFDFTLRPAELADKYRAGRIVLVPFADTTGVFDAFVALGGALIQAVPVGALAVLCVSGGSRGLAGSLLALATIAGLEFLQLLVLSRTADSTDVLGGAIGALIGVRLGALWLARLETPAPTAASARSSSVRLWALAALFVWILVLLVRHWSPFDFTVSRAMFESRVSQLYAAPFYHHYWSDYLHALDEALETMLLAVPVGLLLQMVWPPPRKRPARVAQLLTFVGMAAALFAIIEVGQVFVPSRVPDNTDVVLAVFGTLAGIAIVRMVRRPSARVG